MLKPVSTQPNSTSGTGNQLALAVDLGTSSVRSLLYDVEGNAQPGSLGQRTYELTTTADGGVEADPLAIVALLADCVDETLVHHDSGAGSIAAVGFSCHWHNLLGLDRDGRPTTPVLHLGDNRSADEVTVLRQKLDEAHFRRLTGCMFHSSYWPAKLRWLKHDRPGVFAQTAQWTSIGDFVMRQWHGFTGMSTCTASGTGFLELVSAQWNQELLAQCGVAADEMPFLVDRTTRVTGLRPDLAVRWPAIAQASWFPSLGDGACANVGVAAMGPERVALTLGTTGAVRIVTASPIGAAITPPDRLWVYRLDQHNVVTGAAISNGGLILNWLSDLTGKTEAELLELAATIAPASHDLVMLPFLTGERSPLWNDRARGLIDGLSLHHGPAQLARAGLEAVALRLAAIYGALKPLLPDQHLIAANGGALLKSPLWQQICADTLGHDILALPADLEASARGAALLALHAAGVIEQPAPAANLTATATVVHADPGNTARYAVARAKQEAVITARYP